MKLPRLNFIRASIIAALAVGVCFHSSHVQMSLWLLVYGSVTSAISIFLVAALYFLFLMKTYEYGFCGTLLFNSFFLILCGSIIFVFGWIIYGAAIFFPITFESVQKGKDTSVGILLLMFTGLVIIINYLYIIISATISELYRHETTSIFFIFVRLIVDIYM